MEIVYIVLSVILLAAAIVLLLRNRFYKNQVRSFAEQTKNRTDPDMERPIRVESFGKEFVDLANALNEYTDRQKKTIEEAENDRQNLKMIVAGISHDFRTPLTASIGYLQMIERSHELSENNQKYLTVAVEKNQYLKKLSDEFFEYSLLDTDISEKELKLIPFKSLLENVSLGQYHWITERALDFSAELMSSEAYIRANEEELTRVLENLFSNAKKYAANRLQLDCRCSEGSVVMKMINDTVSGSEISSEHIFEPFFRNSDGSRAGNGLGLYVAKRLAEKYGGGLSAAISDKSEFEITLILPTDKRNPG